MNTSITDGLLYQYLRGELDAHQSGEIADLVDRDSSVQERLESLRWIQDASADVIPQEKVDWNHHAAWEAIDRATKETPVVKLKNRRSQNKPWSIAASIAILVVSAWAAWTFLSSSDPYQNSYTASETHDMHTLPDGTVIWLDEGASVHYDESGRNVLLEGTAYFDVTRDESLPFQLALESGSIEVLGTEFNVRQDVDVIRVSVTEGKVRFSSDTSDRILAVGQMVELDKKNNSLSALQVISTQDLLWHEQVWSYDQIALSTVLQEINEVFHSDIQLVNAEMADCSFSTSGTEAGLTEWLEILARTYNFNVERTPSGYLLQGGKCAE